ncbi:ATP-binding protein [Mycetocola zhadangensis]|uniref:ATP-binding protein n=1 Tax=Mycetocola zhadangensis TaxID=1164595 RepID=UPI003A4DDF49
MPRGSPRLRHRDLADEVPRIFDDFYRASNTKLTGIGGWGLGLSLFRNVLANHNATVDVHSRVGLGTTIAVPVPFERVGTVATTRKKTSSTG